MGNGATNGLNCDGREQKSYGAMAQCPKKKRQNLMVQNFIIPIYSRNSWCFSSMQKQIASHPGAFQTPNLWERQCLRAVAPESSQSIECYGPPSSMIWAPIWAILTILDVWAIVLG